jgi:hypothetical protein
MVRNSGSVENIASQMIEKCGQCCTANPQKGIGVK